MRRRAYALALLFAAVLCLAGCGGGAGTALTEAELAAARGVLGESAQPEDITRASLTAELSERCDSVKKVYLADGGRYVFFASPVGYNGPIDIMLVIDGASARTVALRIVAHRETDHYVRDFENDWFTGRFANKSVFSYMERVKLEAERENQVVAVTGSTVTTDAVVDGVNDCFDVFRALDNPYYVENTGVIELKDALGEPLGEVTLEQLKTLESYRRRLTIHSAAQGDTVHDFRGARLFEAIALADASLLEEYDRIAVSGSDGYESELTMDEVLLENNVYIMYEDNGEPMKTSGGAEGALRLIVLGDDYGQRFTNYVTSLRFLKG